MPSLSIQGIWYRLFQLRGVGNKQLWSLCDKLKGISLTGDFDKDVHIYKEMDWNLDALGRLYKSAFQARTEVQLTNHGIKIHYPASRQNPIMKERARRPDMNALLPAVWFSYGLRHIEQPRIAIVGGRDAPPKYLRRAERLAQILAQKNYTIVSGYARGVDRAAHLGALNADAITWMVLPYGLKRIFSNDNEIQIHHELKKQLIYLNTWREQCSWISQFPISKGWADAQAIQRNTTICVLSKAIIVIWGKSISSGSYQTAKLAQRLNKPLYIIAPSANEVLSPACQSLLDEGYAKALSMEALAQEPWMRP